MRDLLPIIMHIDYSESSKYQLFIAYFETFNWINFINNNLNNYHPYTTLRRFQYCESNTKPNTRSLLVLFLASPY